MHFISSPTGLLVAACSRRPVRVPLDQKKKSAVANATADFLVGCPVGLEPTVSRSTIWRVNRLRYRHHIMRPKGLEPPAHCLEGSCSIHLSYGRTLLSHWVPVWRQCVSAHAARSIIPYSGDPVKNKFENSRFFFFRVSQGRELTTATCPRPPARSPGQRQRERPAPSAPLPVPAVHR